MNDYGSIVRNDSAAKKRGKKKLFSAVESGMAAKVSGKDASMNGSMVKDEPAVKQPLDLALNSKI